MSDDERAEKEQSHFYNGIHSHDRVPIFAVSPFNATKLLVGFVILIAAYFGLIVLPVPLISSATKTAIDHGVGSISRFTLVAFVAILIIDLFAMRIQATGRENAALKQENSDLRQQLAKLNQSN